MNSPKLLSLAAADSFDLADAAGAVTHDGHAGGDSLAGGWRERAQGTDLYAHLVHPQAQTLPSCCVAHMYFTPLVLLAQGDGISHRPIQLRADERRDEGVIECVMAANAPCMGK